MLNIWDFAGEKKFRLLLPSYVSGASGALILYDITNRESLKDLHDWIKVITSVPNSPKTKILVEAKIDLEEQREVTRDDAKNLFEKYGFKGDIIGTSSKTGLKKSLLSLKSVRTPGFTRSKALTRNTAICARVTVSSGQ